MRLAVKELDNDLNRKVEELRKYVLAQNSHISDQVREFNTKIAGFSVLQPTKRNTSGGLQNMINQLNS